MTCQERDRNLLLLSHGELGPLSSAVTKLHVRRCERCRKRLGEFDAVSAVLAQALAPRAGERPLGDNPRPAGTHALPSLTVIALILLIAAAVYLTARSVQTITPTAAPIVHTPVGCRPGLASDKCR